LCITTKSRLDFRTGSKVDIAAGPSNVRFTPKSGHSLSASGCPLCAKSGHSALQYRTPLFDHERGLGILSVEGAPNPDIYNGQTMTGMGH
jgi:hypothetical protein